MEKYWIGSDGENLERMYFTHETAFNSSHNYLDSVDETGAHVGAYKMNSRDEYEEWF